VLYLECCDTILDIEWQNSVLAFQLIQCCQLNDFWVTFYILGLKNAKCDYAELSILPQAIYKQLNNIFIHNKLKTEESSIHLSF